MQLSDFDYDLPEELIAQHPPKDRAAGRLLHVEPPTATTLLALHDRLVRDLPSLLRQDDLLVVNNTRVLPARLFGQKDSGGKVEILLERLLDEQRFLAQVRTSKPWREGVAVTVEGGAKVWCEGRADQFFVLRSDGPAAVMFEQHGHMPLPPYIQRQDELADRERYQTRFAEHHGAVAAPTAGLHFDEALLQALDEHGIRRVAVTLHVGAGTFQPVRVDNVAEHRMHAEWLSVDQSVVDAVAATRAAGGRVVAVGTTVVRALESAASEGELKAHSGDTEIFIYPGYQFRVVDALITNFHLPKSTLLMLVSALAGHDTILTAYRHAVAQRYRFFSYGDAMFIDCQPNGNGHQ
ncbi:MAG: tRNA preQ1(34) S-adenosylmethionine ribosyltransferase-isomerase QueA [Wenzhouxiangellaceae bacterium]